MAKCENENCTHEATHSVTLNIPAKDVAIDLHNPIKMYIGVELCKDHAKSFGEGFDWDENKELREAIEATVATIGGGAADFDRTFHSAISINDHGYLQFLKVKRERSLS